MINDKSNYSSLTPEFKFTSSCTVKSISSPFVNKTLEPARKLKYDPQDVNDLIQQKNDLLKGE